MLLKLLHKELLQQLRLTTIPRSHSKIVQTNEEGVHRNAVKTTLVGHAVLAQTRNLLITRGVLTHVRIRVDLLHHRIQLEVRRVFRRVVRLLLNGVQELARAVALVTQRAERVQIQEGFLAELVSHEQVVARLHEERDDVGTENVHLEGTALALVSLRELVLVADQHVVVAVERPARKDLVASRTHHAFHTGYVVRRRNAFVIGRWLVDQREGHLHFLDMRRREGTNLRQSRDARRDERVRSIAEVAGVFDVATEAEEQPLTRNEFLVRQTTRVVTANVGAVSNVALPLVPNRYV